MKDWIVGKIDQLTGGTGTPVPNLTERWLYQISTRDKRIDDLERQLQKAKAEWAAWKDVANHRVPLMDASGDSCERHSFVPRSLINSPGCHECGLYAEHPMHRGPDQVEPSRHE